jgi:hypothetical protein
MYTSKERYLLRQEVIDYFLFNYEKIGIKEMASGELYIKPYSRSMNFDQVWQKVKTDLKDKKLLVENFEMKPEFIADSMDFPEIMITIEID